MKSPKLSKTPTRPIVRYHGGKWRIAKWIVGNFPEHRTYVEPFGGAGSVLLCKSRSHAEVYNDIESEIVNLFMVVRDHGAELLRALELTPFSRKEFEWSYMPTDSPLEKARRTLVRGFMGFGSNSHAKRTGFRGNSDRSNTTPAMDWRNYPGALPLIIERLQGVVIENRDYRSVMEAHDSSSTLHYVDPPYLPETRGKDRDYRFELSEDDHVEMGRFLATMKGVVIVSGYESALYSEMFSGWVQLERMTFADGARPRKECLWMNREPEQRALL